MENELSIRLARDVLKIEAESVAGLIEKLDDNFTRAVETIYRSRGRVIVTGIGKSGLIGKKIVSTARVKLSSNFSMSPATLSASIFRTSRASRIESSFSMWRRCLSLTFQVLNRHSLFPPNPPS